ncbi:unnamed protein product [Notodromas monacha]|uniref:MBD domain-containing protein n=1 Tax=Notodromas monacha TaxID=399045 RepID=A0A7R9BRC4_9CRUS|nr:unnamed protein product [Notodromas monacha]CAG0919381.1 unnamed protein product [Notodromas monacha]
MDSLRFAMVPLEMEYQAAENNIAWNTGLDLLQVEQNPYNSLQWTTAPEMAYVAPPQPDMMVHQNTVPFLETHYVASEPMTAAPTGECVTVLETRTHGLPEGWCKMLVKQKTPPGESFVVCQVTDGSIFRTSDEIMDYCCKLGMQNVSYELLDLTPWQHQEPSAHTQSVDGQTTCPVPSLTPSLSEDGDLNFADPGNSYDVLNTSTEGLPEGWTRVIVKLEAHGGKPVKSVFFMSPSGDKHWSIKSVRKYFKDNNLGKCNPSDFKFSLIRKKQPGVSGQQLPTDVEPLVLHTSVGAPAGFSKVARRKLYGACAGTFDVFFMSPPPLQRVLRAKKDVLDFLASNNLQDLTLSDFDWSKPKGEIDPEVWTKIDFELQSDSAGYTRYRNLTATRAESGKLNLENEVNSDTVQSFESGENPLSEPPSEPFESNEQPVDSHVENGTKETQSCVPDVTPVDAESTSESADHVSEVTEEFREPGSPKVTETSPESASESKKASELRNFRIRKEHTGKEETSNTELVTPTKDAQRSKPVRVSRSQKKNDSPSFPESGRISPNATHSAVLEALGKSNEDKMIVVRGGKVSVLDSDAIAELATLWGAPSAQKFLDELDRVIETCRKSGSAEKQPSKRSRKYAPIVNSRRSVVKSRRSVVKSRRSAVKPLLEGNRRTSSRRSLRNADFPQVPFVVAEVPNLVAEAPNLVAEVPNLVAEVPNLVSEVPNLVAEKPIVPKVPKKPGRPSKKSAVPEPVIEPVVDTSPVKRKRGRPRKIPVESVCPQEQLVTPLRLVNAKEGILPSPRKRSRLEPKEIPQIPVKSVAPEPVVLETETSVKFPKGRRGRVSRKREMPALVKRLPEAQIVDEPGTPIVEKPEAPIEEKPEAPIKENPEAITPVQMPCGLMELEFRRSLKAFVKLTDCAASSGRKTRGGASKDISKQETKSVIKTDIVEERHKVLSKSCAGLPPGWQKVTFERQIGVRQGHVEQIYQAPCGKKIWSMTMLKDYVAKYRLQNFNFGCFHFKSMSGFEVKRKTAIEKEVSTESPESTPALKLKISRKSRASVSNVAPLRVTRRKRTLEIMGTSFSKISVARKNRIRSKGETYEIIENKPTDAEKHNDLPEDVSLEAPESQENFSAKTLNVKFKSHTMEVSRETTGLPSGWSKIITKQLNRKLGSHSVCFESPDGRRFWTPFGLKQYFKDSGMTETNIASFDFSVESRLSRLSEALPSNDDASVEKDPGTGDSVEETTEGLPAGWSRKVVRVTETSQGKKRARLRVAFRSPAGHSFMCLSKLNEYLDKHKLKVDRALFDFSVSVHRDACEAGLQKSEIITAGTQMGLEDSTCEDSKERMENVSTPLGVKTERVVQ